MASSSVKETVAVDPYDYILYQYFFENFKQQLTPEDNLVSVIELKKLVNVLIITYVSFFGGDNTISTSKKAAVLAEKISIYFRLLGEPANEIAWKFYAAKMRENAYKLVKDGTQVNGEYKNQVSDFAIDTIVAFAQLSADDVRGKEDNIFSILMDIDPNFLKHLFIRVKALGTEGSVEMIKIMKSCIEFRITHLNSLMKTIDGKVL